LRLVKPKALLVDAGGTIYTEGGHPLEGRASALKKAFPDLSAADCLRLAQLLQTSTMAALRGGVQHSDAMTQQVLSAFSPDRDLGAAAVRAAMVESMYGATQAFHGAADLLHKAKNLGLITVLVTDTTWHSEADTWTRVAKMGLTTDLDHVISTFELGTRKPDLRVFHAALDKAGTAASESVMAGDSETADVLPAATLGMATIRVTVQYPLEENTIANATAATLAEVAEILRRWC